MDTDFYAVLNAIAGGNSFWNTIRNTFELIEVAEAEIDRAKEQHPAQAEALHRAFSLLRPHLVGSYQNHELYRHHCRELLARVVKGQDTRPGTQAEGLVALNEVSLQTPIIHDAAAAYAQLFQAIFPHRTDIVAALPAQERYPGRVAEIIGELSRKLTQDWRRAGAQAEAQVPDYQLALQFITQPAQEAQL